jgi:hypothetical protein
LLTLFQYDIQIGVNLVILKGIGGSYEIIKMMRLGSVQGDHVATTLIKTPQTLFRQDFAFWLIITSGVSLTMLISPEVLRFILRRI